MTWWIWMAIGAVLAALELATPGGFVVIFFAVAAFVVGGVSLLGATNDPVVQCLLFSAVALLALRFFRSPMLRRIRKHEGPDTVDKIAGETAIAASDMAPGEYGRAELRGSIWKARNVDAGAVAVGQRCLVVAVEGLSLDIRRA